MSAIRIIKQIDSETLQLPELRQFIGKTVEIIVSESPTVPSRQTTLYDAFLELAGQNVVDSDAYKQLRQSSMI